MPTSSDKSKAKAADTTPSVVAGTTADPTLQTNISGATGETFWERLTSPFPTSWVEKLPRNVKRNDENKAKCERGSNVSADGHYCGGWHARSVHLDYIGHAGITMRLNDVCTPAGWDWSPVWVNENGIPQQSGDEFWIMLKVRDPESGEWIEKMGVGDDFKRSSKQAIGDALRNAAMRYGIGTYLWSKSEHAAELAQHTEPLPQDRADEFYRRVQAAWDMPAGLRILAKEIDEAKVGVFEVMDPTGAKVPLGALVAHRLEGGYENPQPAPPEAPGSAEQGEGGPDTPETPGQGMTDAERLARAQANREAGEKMAREAAEARDNAAKGQQR